MKKIITLITVLIFTNIYAQTPEKFSYQAVIRDASNNLVTDTPIGMQISILKTSANGTAVYSETHSPTTNANGLVSIEIGTGTTSDDFSNINWADDTYFIKTETDPTGGSNYTISGTSQLLSVPYALHAKTASSLFDKNASTREYDGYYVIFNNKGIRTYKASFYITLNSNNQWTGIESERYNHGDTGGVTNYSGTYTENGTQIILSDPSEDVVINFFKSENQLTYFDFYNGKTYEIDLDRVK